MLLGMDTTHSNKPWVENPIKKEKWRGIVLMCTCASRLLFPLPFSVWPISTLSE